MEAYGDNGSWLASWNITKERGICRGKFDAWNHSPESEVVYVSISWLSCCAAAIALKSIPCPRVCTVLMMTRYSASATRFPFPDMCLMQVVYSKLQLVVIAVDLSMVQILWQKRTWMACGPCRLWILCLPGNNESVAWQGRGPGTHSQSCCSFFLLVGGIYWRRLVVDMCHWRAVWKRHPQQLLKHQQWWPRRH